MRKWISAALLLTSAALASSAASQIVVGDPNDRRPEKMGPLSCQAYLRNGGTIHSGIIWADINHPYEGGFREAFEAYVESSYGRTSDVSCSRHSYLDYSSLEANPPAGHVLSRWTGGFATPPEQGSAPVASRPDTPKAPEAPAGEKTAAAAPTPAPVPEHELRYQRELAAYEAKLAEIERIKQDNAEKVARDRAELERAKAQAQAELDKHRAEIAAAEAARKRYEQELAEHQALVDRMQSAADRNRLVDWREALVVCTFNQSDGQTQFGNWRCDGPLQFTYAKLGQEGGPATGGALVALSQACGGQIGSVRDLGLVSGYRVFGCSYGLHPTSNSPFPLDSAKKYGLTYVPGRAIFRCPAWKSGCRTK